MTLRRCLAAILAPQGHRVGSIGDSVVRGEPKERARNVPSRSRVTPYRAGAASRMGRSDDYRRYAKECLDMANTVQDAKARASLLQMAQVWLRLAQRPVAKRQPDHAGK